MIEAVEIVEINGYRFPMILDTDIPPGTILIVSGDASPVEP